MINDKKFDFSKETKIKENLFAAMKHKCINEKIYTDGAGELSDDELRLVAGGVKPDCPFNHGRS